MTCSVCADSAELMRVARPVPDGLAACTAADGEARLVDVALVEPVAPGDVLLVHAGVAIARAEAP